MSSEWKRMTIGDLCGQFGAQIQTGPFGSQLHSYDYTDTGIPVVPTEAIDNGKIILDSLPMISDEKARELARHVLREGDILFARRGAQATGKTAIVRSCDAGVICGTGAIRLRIPESTGIALPSFVATYLSGKETVSWIRHHAIGATMPNLNEGIIRSIPILLPSLQEQKAIAHILGTLDDKIELNRKTNETLEAMAKALFKSWFVDFDPVRAKAEGRPTGLPAEISDLFPDSFDDSELGEIPSGWRVGCLSDCCEITMGQSPPGDTYNEDGDGLPFYQGKTDFGFRFPGRRIYCSAPTRQASIGATLISVRAPVGSANIAKEACSIGRGIAALKSRQSADSFVYYLIGTLQGVFESYNSEGTVFGAINGKDLASIQIVLPSITAIAAYNSQCFPMDESIKSNAQGTEHLINIRHALLPKLISGEIRIPDAEKILEEVVI